MAIITKMLEHLVFDACLNLLHEIADDQLVMAFLAVEIETTMDVNCFLLFPILLDQIDVLLLSLFFNHLLKFNYVVDIVIEDLEDVL